MKLTGARSRRIGGSAAAKCAGAPQVARFSHGLGHDRTYALQQKIYRLLTRSPRWARKQRRRYVWAERRRGSGVGGEFVLRPLW
jgi:hypothetical protein